jgi:hypothetical protein
MNKILATMLAGVILTVSGGIVRAKPFEDASAAIVREDYATIMRLWRPLA